MAYGTALLFFMRVERIPKIPGGVYPLYVGPPHQQAREEELC